METTTQPVQPELLPTPEVLVTSEFGASWPPVAYPWPTPTGIQLATPGVDEQVVAATPAFCDAFCRASTAVQRAVQRAYHQGWSPEVMLDCLEIMACDLALPPHQRQELLDLSTALRSAGVTTPEP